MKTGASKKKQIAAMAAAIMVCICTAASAQSYSLGDEADEVATIQTALTELGLYSADITGHFGEKTETAVKKFQKKYAFETNGIVDEDVFAELCRPRGLVPPVLPPLLRPPPDREDVYKRQVLERWPAFSKFNFHANTTDAKAEMCIRDRRCSASKCRHIWGCHQLDLEHRRVHGAAVLYACLLYTSKSTYKFSSTGWLAVQ